MIGRLVGNVVAEEADGTLVIDVAGVGYEVVAPAGTVARARMQSGTDTVTLHVHTHVREEALTLFGFATPADRSVFRTLIGISNVGPKTAVGILSSLSGAELARAVGNRDVAVLVAIPGVGKKTAERLVLELRDKLDAQPLAPTQVASADRTAKGASSAMVVDALVRMGFKAAEAERAVSALGARAETEPPDRVIREALDILRR